MLPDFKCARWSKLARKTNHIERFNNTLRQRVSRLVRDALSFSKKLANHIGAIKLFICHYNLTRAAAYSEHYMDITTARRPLPEHVSPTISASFEGLSCPTTLQCPRIFYTDLDSLFCKARESTADPDWEPLVSTGRKLGRDQGLARLLGASERASGCCHRLTRERPTRRHHRYPHPIFVSLAGLLTRLFTD